MQVTAGNASTISDGAACVVLASGSAVARLGLRPRARLIGFADAAVTPEDFPIAPAKAIPLALQRAGLQASQIDAWEINEAFAVVVLANLKLLGINHDKVGLSPRCFTSLHRSLFKKCVRKILTLLSLRILRAGQCERGSSGSRAPDRSIRRSDCGDVVWGFRADGWALRLCCHLQRGWWRFVRRHRASLSETVTAMICSVN